MTARLACNACASKESAPLAGRHPLVRCAACGLVFRSDAADEFDAAMYEYYAARSGLERDEVHPADTGARLAAALDGVSRRCRGRRLLDVGCGEGQLVAVAVEQGWTASGIDLSREAVSTCHRLGLPCAVRDFLTDELDGAPFDAVTMVELIEHVPNPGEFLRQARQLLAPGGVVYVTTPNFASLGHRVLGDDWPVIAAEHLSYFTPRTLLRTARDAGLEPLHVETVNLSAAAVARLLRRDRGIATEGKTAFDANLQLRRDIDGSRPLRAAKAVVNTLLRLTSTGETIKAAFGAAP